jgi:hypothetical protein
MRQAAFLLILSMLGAVSSLPGQAAVLEGVQYDDSVNVGNRELKLNGLGLRAVLFFKVYVAGLYLSDQTNAPEQILKNVGPKRLQLRMLREISAADINKALIDGIKERSSPSEWATLQERASQFSRTIDTIGSSRQGDSIILDYLPSTGTTLMVNNASQGYPIQGLDFYNAILSIFIGGRPVDTRLKQGLLGQGN